MNDDDAADTQFTSSMSRLDADVRVVDPVDRRSPSSNKLRMLELDRTDEFDVLPMLDCDVIVRGDLSSAVEPSTLRAAPAVGCQFTDEIWEGIYDDLSLARPVYSTVMTITGEITYPYYNGGVLFVPRRRLSHRRRHRRLREPAEVCQVIGLAGLSAAVEGAVLRRENRRAQPTGTAGR